MTKDQKQLLNYTAKKVDKLFSIFSVPAHGIDHIKRVVKWTQILLKKEKVRNPFLCLMSAWLHDIGRTLEKGEKGFGRGHHELSYLLLKKWFREDRNFDCLSDGEKTELLYAVRYHWNDFADEYDTAWVLRDADKLDGFGNIGVKRATDFYQKNEKIEMSLRLNFGSPHFLHTKTANEIFKKKKLLYPIEKRYKKLLLSKIEKIEL